MRKIAKPAMTSRPIIKILANPSPKPKLLANQAKPETSGQAAQHGTDPRRLFGRGGIGLPGCCAVRGSLLAGRRRQAWVA